MCEIQQDHSIQAVIHDFVFLHVKSNGPGLHPALSCMN